MKFCVLFSDNCRDIAPSKSFFFEFAGVDLEKTHYFQEKHILVNSDQEEHIFSRKNTFSWKKCVLLYQNRLGSYSLLKCVFPENNVFFLIRMGNGV